LIFQELKEHGVLLLFRINLLPQEHCIYTFQIRRLEAEEGRRGGEGEGEKREKEAILAVSAH